MLVDARIHELSRRVPIVIISPAGFIPFQVCHKCAVPFDPKCAKALLFNTSADCFRAGLMFGKLLIFNGAKTWKTLSDSPTLNQ